jgi:hypothetical protein
VAGKGHRWSNSECQKNVNVEKSCHRYSSRLNYFKPTRNTNKDK